eukprot:753649-Hanusia_phi.AAC.3
MSTLPHACTRQVERRYKLVEKRYKFVVPFLKAEYLLSLSLIAGGVSPVPSGLSPVPRNLSHFLSLIVVAARRRNAHASTETSQHESGDADVACARKDLLPHMRLSDTQKRIGRKNGGRREQEMMREEGMREGTERRWEDERGR